MFVINFKNYAEVSGDKGIELAKTASEIAKKFKVKVAIAPPIPMLSSFTNFRSLVTLSQHVDDAKIGSTTGYVIPEMLQSIGTKGSIINHSEHRISRNEVVQLVNRLRKLSMISVVCVKNAKEAGIFATYEPDYIAIEPPELIGTGRAVSKEKPFVITESAKKITEKSKETKLLCGAGIVDATDVSKALELGSKGILVASGIIKARNWKKIITDFSKKMMVV